MRRKLRRARACWTGHRAWSVAEASRFAVDTKEEVLNRRSAVEREEDQAEVLDRLPRVGHAEKVRRVSLQYPRGLLFDCRSDGLPQWVGCEVAAEPRPLDAAERRVATTVRRCLDVPRGSPSDP